MEKAIHITKPDNLKYFNSDYDRIYYGVEFCQHLIPSTKNLEKILSFTRKRDLRFTFVTPFVAEKGLYRLNKLFRFLKTRMADCEVVVNDWGVLMVLSKKYKTFKPSLGRLLTRQSRDPAMGHILKKQPPCGVKTKDGKIKIIAHIPPAEYYQEGIKGSYVNTPSVQRFLSRFNIHRIEINNIIQGFNLKNAGFKVSLYTPFINIATTRFCPMESRFQKIHRINVCKRECQKYYSLLKNKAMPKLLYGRGNTIFYKNPVNLKTVNNPVIDRVVFQPELPF